MTAFELAGKLKLDSSEFTSSLGKQESVFKRFGNKLNGMAKTVGRVAGVAMATVGAGMVMVAKSSVQEGRAFDKAMAQVAATLGKTTDEVQELSTFARKMGSETAFSATQAAEALNYMALAGYSDKESMAMLPTVLDLAAAGNMDLAKASDMVTDAQSALGLRMDQTKDLVDQMAKTASKSNTSVEQLGDAFLTVGGTAKMMKGGTKELSAVLGVLADNGIKGSEGGTALRNVLLALSAPTSKASKQIKKLGLDVYDAEGNMRSIPDIMGDMGKAMEGMTGKERTSIINEIFNKRDLKSVEALLGTDKKRWLELSSAIGDAKGSAKQMAETQLDNLEGDMVKFKSAMSEAKITMSDGLTPTLRKFTQIGTKLVQRLTNSFKKGGLKGAIKDVNTMFSDFVNNMKNSENKTVRSIGKTIDWFKDLKNSKSLKEVGTKVVSGLKLAFKNVKIKVADVLGIEDSKNASWKDYAKKIKEGLKNGLSTIKLKAADLLGIENTEEATWSDIGKKILDGVTKYASNSGTFLKKLILGDSYNDKSTWSDVGQKISGWMTEAFKEGGLISALLGNTVEKGKAIVEFASQFITGIADWMSTETGSKGVVDIVTALANGLATAAPAVIEALSKVLGNEELWKSMIRGLAKIGEALWDAILGKDVTNAIRRFFGVDIPGEITGAMRQSIDDTWRDIWTEYYDAGYDEGKKAKAKTKWNDFISDMFTKAGGDPSKLEGFMSKFNFDALVEKWESGTTLPADFFQKIFDGLNDPEVKLKADDSDITSTLAEGYSATVKLNADYSGLNGSVVTDNGGRKPRGHAKGLWSVPYDNYPALLHRDETVLNASRARKYRNNETEVSSAETVAEIVGSAVKEAFKHANVLMSGEKVGDLTTKRVRRNINARTFARTRAFGG